MFQIKYLTFFFFFSFSYFTLAAGSGFDSDNEDVITAGKLVFKVYRLKVHDIGIDDFNEDTSGYNSYPCQVNMGCKWYSRPRSLTAPPYWNLVEKGTGCVIEYDRVDRNKGEHWLYFLPSSVTGLSVSFAIVFGKGGFFKSAKYQEAGEISSFSIRQDLGYTNFGSKIVRNIVENPKILAQKGTLGGKPCYPYSQLFTYVQGLDYCSIKKKITSVQQFLAVCRNLETLYWQGEYELHSYFEEHIRAANLRKSDVTDRIENPNTEEDAEQEEADDDPIKSNDIFTADEGNRVVTFKDGKEERTAYRLFGKYYTFDGLDQFLEDTRQKVHKLCCGEFLNLPAFNKTELKKHLPPASQEQEENGKKKRVDWEGIYNAHAAQVTDYVLLDKRLVRNVEVCDLLANLEHRCLIHVKIGTDSSQLNHLFGQGYASACLMSQGEYPEEVFLKLVREFLFERASTILAEEFKNGSPDLWNEFKKWRDTHLNMKGLLDEEAESTVVEEILGKINKTSKTVQEAVENLESIKDESDVSTQSLLEQVIKTLKTALNSGDSSLPQVEKILREKFSPKRGRREKLIWESNAFPDKKEDLEEFCKALKNSKLKTKQDSSAKNIASKLEKYRKDLLDNHIKESFDAVGSCLKVEKDKKKIKAYAPSQLRTKIDSEDDPDEKIKIVLSAFKENYLKKRTKQISKNQLESVIEHEEVLIYIRQLYDSVLIPQENQIVGQVLKVVFAIITDKNVEDPEFMPLGARVNLIRVAEDLIKLSSTSGRVSFSPVVVTIQDTTSLLKARNIKQVAKKRKEEAMEGIKDKKRAREEGEESERKVITSHKNPNISPLSGKTQEASQDSLDTIAAKKELNLFFQLYHTEERGKIPISILTKIEANEKWGEMRRFATNMTDTLISEMPSFQREFFRGIRTNSTPPFSDQILLDCITNKNKNQKSLHRDHNAAIHGQSDRDQDEGLDEKVTDNNSDQLVTKKRIKEKTPGNKAGKPHSSKKKSKIDEKSESTNNANSQAHDEIDSLQSVDFGYLNIPLMENIDDLPIFNKPLNIVQGPKKEYTIGGRIFRRQNVSGSSMRCFFNSVGLVASDVIKTLKLHLNDPIVRYMIANEIISAARNPEQLPEEVKEATNFALYEFQRDAVDEQETQRSEQLAMQELEGGVQNVSALSTFLQSTGKRGEDILDDWRKRSLSLKAFNAFIVHHILNEKMMVALHDVNGDEGGNTNANYTSIDAVAFVNNLALLIYQPNGENSLRLVHQFIPQGATKVVYLYHQGVHFQALIPK